MIGRLNGTRAKILRATIASAGLAAFGGSAQGQSADRWYVDVSGGVGYSTSPFLTGANEEGSGTADFTVNPHYAARDELGSVDLDANFRRVFYFNRYDNSEDYGASVRAARSLDAVTSASGSLRYSSSILGEQGAFPGDPNDPDVPDVDDPDLGLLGFGQRRNLIAADASISTMASERDQISVSFAGSRSSYSGTNGDDFSSMNGSVSYNRTFSVRTSVGASMSIQKVLYDETSFYNSTVYTPQLTLKRQLSSTISLDLAAGALFIESATPGGSSTGLSGNLNLCYADDRSSACLSAFSDASGSGFGGTRKSTGASVNGSYRFGENDTLRGSVSFTRFGEGQLFSIERDYISAGLYWDKKLTDRLSGGARLTYRSSSGGGVFGGFGDGNDFGASLSVRYRFGEIR